MFKRLGRVFRANANAALDRLEDPTKMTDQYLRDLDRDIENFSQELAKALAGHNRVRKEFEEVEAKIIDREQKAETALSRGHEDLARRLLLDKQGMMTRYNHLKDLVISGEERTIPHLKDKLAELRNQRDSLRGKRNSIAARQSSAVATKKANRALSRIGNGAVAGVARMEDRILQLEAEADASGEMLTIGKSLDREFSDKVGVSVDAELEALRQKLAQ